MSWWALYEGKYVIHFLIINTYPRIVSIVHLKNSISTITGLPLRELRRALSFDIHRRGTNTEQYGGLYYGSGGEKICRSHCLLQAASRDSRNWLEHSRNSMDLRKNRFLSRCSGVRYLYAR